MVGATRSLSISSDGPLQVEVYIAVCGSGGGTHAQPNNIISYYYYILLLIRFLPARRRRPCSHTNTAVADGSVRFQQRAEHDAHRLSRAVAIIVPHRTGGPQSGGSRRQDDADQGSRGPVGGYTGAHVQELGERARAGCRPGVESRGRPAGRPCPLRAGREPSEAQGVRVESQPRQPAPDAGERVQGLDGDRGRRRQAGQHRCVLLYLRPRSTIYIYILMNI